MITLEELQAAREVLDEWRKETDYISLDDWISQQIDSKSEEWECVQELKRWNRCLRAGNQYSVSYLSVLEIDPTKFPFHFKKVQP